MNNEQAKPIMNPITCDTLAILCALSIAFGNCSPYKPDDK
jgi:hypothetical protein